jgi:hypothetical protein
VTVWHPVNRYSLQPVGLFVPYGLANLLSFVVMVMAIVSYYSNGVYPDKGRATLVSATKDTEVSEIFRRREGYIRIEMTGEGGEGGEGEEGEILAAWLVGFTHSSAGLSCDSRYSHICSLRLQPLV